MSLKSRQAWRLEATHGTFNIQKKKEIEEVVQGYGSGENKAVQKYELIHGLLHQLQNKLLTFSLHHQNQFVQEINVHVCPPCICLYVTHKLTWTFAALRTFLRVCPMVSGEKMVIETFIISNKNLQRMWPDDSEFPSSLRFHYYAFYIICSITLLLHLILITLFLVRLFELNYI